MRVAVVLEHRFERTPDGRVWTQGPFPYSFFTRYLDGFDAVRVVARVATVRQARAGALAADGEGVEFRGVPDYHGPWEYLRRRVGLAAAITCALDPEDAVILRIPSQVASLVAARLAGQGRAYAAEVVGDPWDAMAPGAFRHPLRPVFRYLQTREMARQCRYASATAYVTEHALQRRYPPAAHAPTTHYSSVELRDEAFVSSPPTAPPAATKLISVGSMEHLYKGQDTLLTAVRQCLDEGLEIRLTLVGDGRCRPFLENRVRDLLLGRVVRFHGAAPSGAAVRELLDEADLFVLPSRQEGAPRALLEAMARGLPAISSTVGGIPELLCEEDLAPPDEPEALASRIAEVCRDAPRRDRMAARNLDRAHEYHDAVLGRRRRAFYSVVRGQTALHRREREIAVAPQVARGRD